MILKDIRSMACTNMKVYVGNKMVYSPYKGNLKSYLGRKVEWLDAEDDIIVVGIEGGEKHEKEN